MDKITCEQVKRLIEKYQKSEIEYGTLHNKIEHHILGDDPERDIKSGCERCCELFGKAIFSNWQDNIETVDVEDEDWVWEWNEPADVPLKYAEKKEDIMKALVAAFMMACARVVSRQQAMEANENIVYEGEFLRRKEDDSGNVTLQGAFEVKNKSFFGGRYILRVRLDKGTLKFQGSIPEDGKVKVQIKDLPAGTPLDVPWSVFDIELLEQE